jgi:hypothetical protein
LTLLLWVRAHQRPLVTGVPDKRSAVNAAEIIDLSCGRRRIGGGVIRNNRALPTLVSANEERGQRVRFTNASPAATSITAAAKAQVSGSRRTKWPAATPNSGVRKVKAESRLAE